MKQTITDFKKEEHSVVFVIWENPVPKGRPRSTLRNNKINVFTDTKTRQYEFRTKLWLVRKVGFTQFEGALKVTAHFYIKPPKKYKKEDIEKEKYYPKTRPDLDNYVKTLLDVCNGIIFKDDAQVVEIETFKKYANEPKTFVKVEVLNGTKEKTK